MRDIWICDAEGEVWEELGSLGLSSEVWRELYPSLAGDPERPILARLWREQWGPRADATLSWTEVGRLAEELEGLRSSLDPALSAAARTFYNDLFALCDRARDQGGGLRFIAD